MFVCPSDFLAPIWDRGIIHTVQIPFIYEYLFYFKLRYVGQPKKDKNVNTYIETPFSRPLIKIEVLFILCTFLLFMSIYSINISSVGMTVSLEKAEM